MPQVYKPEDYLDPDELNGKTLEEASEYLLNLSKLYPAESRLEFVPDFQERGDPTFYPKYLIK